MRNTTVPHPGILLRKKVIERNGLTVTQAAKILKVGRVAMSNLLNGKAAISLEMCLKIGIVFGEAADVWYNRQIAYDLEKAKKRISQLKLRPYNAAY